MNLNIIVLFISITLYYILFQYPKVEFESHKNGCILITGASSGIGKDAALYIANKYEFTVFAGVRKEKDGKEVISEFNKLSNSKGKLKYVILDVTNREHVDNVADLLEKWTRDNKLPFVALVNNAGIGLPTPGEFIYFLKDKARKVIEVNLLAVMDLSSRLTPLLRASKGRIINVSSISGYFATQFSGVYSASKFGLEGYSDAIRRELKRFGVSVSVVEPGFVHTKMGDRSDGFVEQARKLIPKEIASPYEKQYFKGYTESRTKSRKAGTTTEVTNLAIEDAIINPNPKVRYPVAGGGGFSAYQVRLMGSFLPDRFQDTLTELFGH